MDFIKSDPDFKKYRPNAGCVIVNQEGRILYCERADIPGAWQMPQGGIDQGEDPEKGALRELFEETCIQDVTVLETYPDWLVYKYPNGELGKSGHIGQAQKWFLIKYNGDPDAINLDDAQDREFTTHLWATPEYILQDVADFRKPLYAECFRHFGLAK